MTHQSFELPEKLPLLTYREKYKRQYSSEVSHFLQSEWTAEPTLQHLFSDQEIADDQLRMMFNEGYSALEGDDIIRRDLCREAIRLTEIMADHPKISQKSNTYALLSLMLLDASRFTTRQSDEGSLIELADHDRGQWAGRMIEKGLGYLYRAFEEKIKIISKYQILATISAHHCTAKSEETNNCSGILSLYDNLMEIEPSVVVFLNRAVAISKVYGAQKAIDEPEKFFHLMTFKNEEAENLHRKSEYCKWFVDKLYPLCTEMSRPSVYNETK